MVKWKYVGRHGSLDLVADSYTCLIKKYGGPMLIFANGSRTADVIFRPDAGFSAEPGKFVPEAGTDSLSGKGDKFEFSYTCDDGVRLVVSFYDDRIEAF